MAELEPEVLARAGYCCERCGRSDAPLEAHHRKPKGRGGPDTMENLACLCGPYPEGCHGWAHLGDPAEARRIGLLIPRWEPDPSEPWAGPPEPSPPLPRPGW